MLTLNGKTLQYDKAFEHEGRQYPKNWLRLTTLQEKQAIGIVVVPDEPGVYVDYRFYISEGNPHDLDELKTKWTATVKGIAGSMLSETDWYVVRQAENSAAVPAEVLARRGEIRTFSNQKEAAIASCEDVDALAAYINSSEYGRWEPTPEPVVEETPTPAE